MVILFPQQKNSKEPNTLLISACKRAFVFYQAAAQSIAVPKAAPVLLKEDTLRDYDDESYPAVRYLHESAEFASLERFDNKLNIHRLLLQLNDFMYTPKDSALEPIIRTIYALYEEDPHSIVAVLGFLDSCMDYYVQNKIEQQQKLQFLDKAIEQLLKPMIMLARGFNVWHLARRWRSIEVESNYPKALRELQLVYEANAAKRKSLSELLVEEFNNDYYRFGMTMEAYPRSLPSLFRSSLPASEIAEAIFLKISCEGLVDSYVAEGWIESKGRVHPRFTRKSLFHAEENGTKRLQIGVWYQLQKPASLIIARIATPEIHQDNEWGCIRRILKQAETHNQGKTRPSSEERITVKLWSGRKVELPQGATIDTLLKQEFEKTADSCVEMVVNGKADQVRNRLLNNGDVVYFRFDQRLEVFTHPRRLEIDKVNSNIPSLYQPQNQYSEELLKEGRQMLIFEINQYLNNYKELRNHPVFRKIEERLPILLTAVGFINSRVTLNDYYTSIGNGTLDVPPYLGLAALQYFLLKDYVCTRNFEPIENIHWSQMEIGSCCQSALSYESKIRAIRFEPNQEQHDLRYEIHLEHCPRIEPINTEDIRWISKRSTRNHHGYEIYVPIFDGTGSLGDLLSKLYTVPTLSLHWIQADSINYRNPASALAYVTVLGERGRAMIEQQLFSRYDPKSVNIRSISKQRCAEMLFDMKLNPYNNHTATLDEDELKIGLYVGREKEFTELTHLLRTNPHCLVLIEGYHRVGKTWFLKHFALRSTLPNRIPIYLSFETFFESNLSRGNLFRSIYTQIKKGLSHYPLFANDALDSLVDGRPQNMRSLIAWIDKIYQQYGYELVILIDEFTMINEWILSPDSDINRDILQEFLNGFDNVTGASFVLVFQASFANELVDVDAEILELYKTLVKGYSVGSIHIEPLKAEEIHDLMRNPSSGVFKLADEIAEEIVDLCGGISFFVQMMGSVLWSWAIEQQAADTDEIQEIIIDKASLDKIVQRTVIDNQDRLWDAYFFRFIKNLRPKVQDTLKLLARLAQSSKQGFVAEQQIIERSKSSETRLILENLLNSNLLEKQADSYRIRGSLMRQYLARLQ